jgi:hypothetical protein
MSIPEPMARTSPTPPLTIAGWSLFDKVRYRWGGGGDILLGISLIGAAHNIIFGILFILLGIATWAFTRFGHGDSSLVVEKDPDRWYAAWNSMSTVGRVIAGIGSAIGNLFLYVLFFWFFILRLVWKHIIAPGLGS